MECIPVFAQQRKPFSVALTAVYLRAIRLCPFFTCIINRGRSNSMVRHAGLVELKAILELQSEFLSSGSLGQYQPALLRFARLLETPCLSVGRSQRAHKAGRARAGSFVHV